LIGLFVGLEAMHSARDAHATKGFAPRDGAGLVAGGRRNPARHSCQRADKAVNLLFHADEWWFHPAERLSLQSRQRQRRKMACFNHGWARMGIVAGGVTPCAPPQDILQTGRTE